ncbi:MAG: class I SAM-dependent methyltransferase [Pirellulales bacterium]
MNDKLQAHTYMSQPPPPVGFDQATANNYDRHWTKLAPLRDAQHVLIAAILADLPDTAHILCVGVGTGHELFALAERFPNWCFTAVEPSAPMLTVCRNKAAAAGISDRCTFHEGYLDTLPLAEQPYDAATALLVSQFLLERSARVAFFAEIAARLRSDGIFVNADLSGDVRSDEYSDVLDVWIRMMRGADIPAENAERLRTVYERQVAVRPVAETTEMIVEGGFTTPRAFYQAGLIHAWFARRLPSI